MTGHRAVGSAASGHIGLCTDLYELRMVESYLRRGMTQPATFSLFIRPATARPWYVAFGVQRLTELIAGFSFGPEELAYLAQQGFAEDTLSWLGDFAAAGELWAVPDGTVVLAQEPIAEFTAPLPIAQIFETAVINLAQYGTSVATKAARCALAADGRRLADFGFRRAHGLETGIEAALAAWVGGGFATSNVEAGRRHGLPVTGTMAHSYVQAFADEREAFRTFAADHPDHTVLLVDTYDTVEGVRRAIDVGRELRERDQHVQGVRLDSGDLAALSRQARDLLDDAGFRDTQVIASGGLDEHRIADLVAAGAPIDAFGVGSSLVTATDQPALDIVYKLVDYDGRAVAKFSGVKSTWPGRKQVFRSDAGPQEDRLSVRDAREPGTPLLERTWADGEDAHALDAEAVRSRVVAGLDSLPEEWRSAPFPEKAPLPRIGADLEALSEKVRRAAFG